MPDKPEPKNSQTSALSELSGELLKEAGIAASSGLRKAAIPLMVSAAHHITRLETALAQIGFQVELVRYNAEVASAQRDIARNEADGS